MLVIGIMGIVVVLMAIQFKSIKPEYGIMISVVGCTFIFLYSLVRVKEIVEMVERLAGITSVSREYIKIILKITGVTFISEIASDIAKDCGYQAVANQVQIFGKLSVLVISFPVFTELISSIGKLFRETFRKEIFQINYRKENIMRIINTKFIFKLVLLFFILLFLSPKPVKAGVISEEIITIDDFDLEDSGKILKTQGYDNIDYKYILKKLRDGDLLLVLKEIGRTAYEKTIGDVSLIEKTLVNLLLITIIASFFTNFANVFSKNGISDTGFYICYMVTVAIMVTMFEEFSIIAAQLVKLLLKFVGGMIPAYFLSVAIVGQAAAAGFYQLTLVIIEVCQFVFLKITLPAIKIYMAISLVNNISREDFLSGTTHVIENFINFVNKTMVGIVTGLNIIQGLILPSVDMAKNTTIKKFIGTLPVIGDGADAVTGMLLGSANLIKNCIGTFGIIMIILICFVPYMKLQIYSASIQIFTAIIQPVADRRIIESLNCLCNGIRLLIRVVISSGFLFVISIAIICMTTNVKT